MTDKEKNENIRKIFNSLNPEVKSAMKAICESWNDFYRVKDIQPVPLAKELFKGSIELIELEHFPPSVTDVFKDWFPISEKLLLDSDGKMADVENPQIEFFKKQILYNGASLDEIIEGRFNSLKNHTILNDLDFLEKEIIDIKDKLDELEKDRKTEKENSGSQSRKASIIQRAKTAHSEYIDWLIEELKLAKRDTSIIAPIENITSGEQAKKVSAGDINYFCRSMPLIIAKDHFKIFTEVKSKNGSPFLTVEQLNDFIERAFCGNSKIPKLNFNMAPRGDIGKIKGVFHSFYDKCCFEYFNTMQCQDKFIKLLTDSFNGWPFDKVKRNFKSQNI